MDTIKALVEHKKYSAITEYSKIIHGKDNLIVSEYGGTNVRLYKDNDDNVRLLCPKKMDVVQEGHVANAIANGSVFADAESIDNNACCIERLSIPYDAMVNSGKDVPQNLKPMIAIVIGKMNNDGSFDVGDDARATGTNFVRDLSDAKSEGKPINGVIDKYVEKTPEGFYTPEIGKSISKLNNEMDDVNETDPSDVISDEDTVDSYEGVEVDDVDSDNEDAPKTATVDSSEDEDGLAEEANKDGEEPSEEEDEATDEEADAADAAEEDAPNTSTVDSSEDEDGINPESDEDEEVEECGNNCDTGNKPVVQEDGEESAEETEPIEDAGTEEPVEDTDESDDAEPVEECGDTKIPVTPIQEGFLSKKPKKLKPINRDVVAYITVEMNNIHSANDQAMLAGYTCSKIEMVDWYITVIDTQDPKYIVPHTRQYLVSLKSQLESLLAQILKIRPINRSDQIWRVNYPQVSY